MLKTQGFHNTIDTMSRAYQSLGADGRWKARSTHVTVLQRSVEYQWFAHFHPYVPALVRQLDRYGFRGLQDSDTLYLPQTPDTSTTQPQPFQTLPDSTRAVLAANVSAKRPDGSAVALTAGTPLTLRNGTAVTIPANTQLQRLDGTSLKLNAPVVVNVPAKIPVSSSGLQFTVNGAEGLLAENSAVTVSVPDPPKYAVLSNDGTEVQLPPQTQVIIRSGVPQPYFYEQIFTSKYQPDWSWVEQPGPVKNIDFAYDGAYSLYNWELFFHAPLLIAVHLSQNQRYQDAQQWFHYIFNPTDNSPGPTPERFWKVAPFQTTDVEMVQEILINLSTQQDPRLFQQTVLSINDWMQNPFQPWEVAKFRPTAYMLKTVMAYLDNLIAWGDSLFQQYTIETINEATQLYIMAANILGRKPQPVPKKSSGKALTYNDLRSLALDPLGNALVEAEVDIPFDNLPAAGDSAPGDGAAILPSLGQTLYFCVPQNDRLLAYWDTVADRLFKIHNSLNLQGVFQRLPLFDPPIDPALLVRAAASGLDVSAVVSGLNQPLPLVRFQLLVSKAGEICQEVKSLGANLLSAIEKQDNETLALLRAQHESAILSLAEAVKYSQWQEAIKSRQGLEVSLANATQKYTYYQKLLGRSDSQIQSSIPQLAGLDEASLNSLKFSQADSSAEPQMGPDSITPDIAANSAAVSDGELKTLSSHEVGEINSLGIAQGFQQTANAVNAIGAILALIPQFGGHVQPMGCGATIKFGGDNLSFNTDALAAVARAAAEYASFTASMTAKIGGYARRELDWTYQSNSAKEEINLIFKQLRGAQIREAIAKKEYDNHQVQMQNAQQIVDFLQGNDIGKSYQTKETTTGFYALMKREVKALYAKAFQLAFEVARKAERALQHELGNTSLTFVQYNYLDGNEGLLAGEKLFFDIKSMEMAYHDLNQREYELTKHVSLSQVGPLALLQLRATGSCGFTLPEEVFDLDGPGHYFRRAKSIAVTLPCVAGPYTSVNCTLTLQKSSTRISTQLPNGKYARINSDDSRFDDYYGAMQTIVTSSAQADAGLFETNLRDERYLPFENAGIAGSEWQLSLPADVPQFDFDTITDVVLHIRYTAREGGEVLRQAAVKNLRTDISKAQAIGSVRLFSVRHDFPSPWAKFQNANVAGGSAAELALTLTPEMYPFWAAASGKITGIQLFAEFSDKTGAVNLYAKADKSAPAKPDTLVPNPAYGGLLAGALVSIKPPASVTGPFTLYFDNNKMQDLWLAITWKSA